ncbi:MAG: YcnI family protein [Pseudonocardiales bacterium]|nr:YcnI family protein [Pseudonocardiales bacterium]
MRLHHRLAAILVPAALLVGLSAGVASAHVSVSSPEATQGGYAVITFRVPTESATLSTIGLRVQLPTDTPFASVSVEPMTGWSYTVTKTTLATPIQTDDGPVTQAISEVDWTATADGIKPGEFLEFKISAGPLPDKSSVTFKAIQRYSDNSEVSWVEVAAPGSAEPEHPAPTLTLAPAAASGASAPSTPTTSSTPTASATLMPEMYADNGDYAKQSAVTTALITSAIAIFLAAVGFGIGFAAWRRTRP